MLSKPLIILPVLTILALLFAAGRKMQADLAAQHLPSGRMIDVGGYKLYLDCKGEGAPTVIMDAGGGLGSSLAFAPLQSKIAQFTRVCVYDRAGQGWSEASPKPRTSQVIVSELYTLLERAGIPGPFILVGYSFGGLNMRLFAYEHSARVAGMVLVDSSHEDQFQAFGTRTSPIVFGALKAVPLLISTGIPALFRSLVPIPGAEYLSADTLETYRALLVSDPKMARTAVEETALIETSFTQVKQARQRLGERPLKDIPLIVLMKGKAEAIPGLSLSPERQQEIWKNLQQDLAAQSTRGRLSIAAESGHDIIYHSADLVTDAIRELVRMTH